MFYLERVIVISIWITTFTLLYKLSISNIPLEIDVITVFSSLIAITIYMTYEYSNIPYCIYLLNTNTKIRIV